MMDWPLLGRAILKLLLKLGTDKARTGRYHRICGEIMGLVRPAPLIFYDA
jgi:hypothetical protein